jgi:GAF domain-containing protein
MEEPLPLESPRGPLHSSSAAEPDDARYLYRVIRTIRSGRELDTILRHVIRLATEATDCRGCFIYLLQGRELVLRAASRTYSHAEGRVRLSIDEGLVGWAARTRRSVSIEDRAYDDPRVVPVPELQGEQFQSMIAVPILSRTGGAIGVIGMHTRAPRTFLRHEIEFMEHTALLVAGAIEGARQAEEARSRAETLAALSDMARQVAAASSARELLPLVVRACRGLLAADRCDLYLMGAADRLVLRAASPARPLGRTVTAGELGPGRVPGRRESRTGGVPLWAPLVAGDEQVGVLYALVPRSPSDGQSLLTTIAAHVAVAVKRHQQVDALLDGNLARDFLQALADERPAEDEAARLGCDLGATHVVLHAMPWTSPQTETMRRFEASLRVRVTGSIVDRGDASVRALLPLPASGATAIADLVRHLHAAAGGSLAVGLSDGGRGATAHARGFAHAEAAARVGALLRGGAGVSTYEDLGAYRYALGAEATVRDRHQDCIEQLCAYQRRRGTDLVRTLETYLELRANIAQTSRRLSMHPNTLRQRLARIEQLTGLRIDDEDGVSLAMAIKAVKLRWLRARSTG